MNGFFIKNLPDRDCLEQFSEKHPEMDPGVMEVYLHFLHLGAEVGNRITEYLSGHKLSTGRFSILMILNGHPDDPMTPGELAERCGVTAATISRLVEGLIQEGHLTRVPNPDNRRVSPVKISPEGRQYLEQLLPGYFARVNQMFGALSGSELASLLKLFKKLKTNLNETN